VLSGIVPLLPFDITGGSRRCAHRLRPADPAARCRCPDLAGNSSRDRWRGRV